MNISCKILINILKHGQIDGKLTEIDNRHTNINENTCKSWNIRISSGFTTKEFNHNHNHKTSQRKIKILRLQSNTHEVIILISISRRVQSDRSKNMAKYEYLNRILPKNEKKKNINSWRDNITNDNIPISAPHTHTKHVYEYILSKEMTKLYA